MPSPRWSLPTEPVPIAAAIAAAVHAAWEAPERQAYTVFQEVLRKLVGPDVFPKIEPRAFRIYQLQQRKPDNLRVPPSWAWFVICPHCLRLNRTKYTVPQNGRLELQVLRDPDWLADRLERRPIKQIAADLGCTTSIVRYWIDKHGITPPKTARTAELEAGVRRMHAQGEGPGTIAEALDSTVSQIRKILKRLGLATRKQGHVYHSREWWRVRLEDQRLTLYECARQAGVKPHTASWYATKFDLGHAVDRTRRRRRRYPELGDPEYLRALLERHRGCYAHAAAEVGCEPTLVSERARQVLGLPKRHSNRLAHSGRGWWQKRIKQGKTTQEMADEAGVKEPTARERCRIFGLLPKAYENNRRAEGNGRRR